MREFLARIIDWFRRGRLERELAEEIRFHTEHAERDARAEGHTSEHARWVARRRFGNVTASAELARDRWSLPALDHLQQDIRYALRGLRRSRGFTLTATLTLALGIGANVAMFGVVDRLMFRPYPYLRDPARVHRVYMRATYRGTESWGYGGEYARYLDLRRFTTRFDELAGFARQSMMVGSGDIARERAVATVSASFWSFFDAAPALGRYFVAAEDSTPRGHEVAVVSYAFWKNELGGRDVVGEPLQVGDLTTTIVGVTPAGFTGVFDGDAPAVYIPITLYAGSVSGREDRATYYTRYHWGWMDTMVRRRTGVSVAQASADITQAFRRSWQAMLDIEPAEDPLELAKPHGVVGPMKVAAGPDSPLEARTAVWVSGVAAVVLLIACANVANLSLARALRRQREVAMRLALGISRRRLMAQMIAEGLVLALLGSVGGLVVARWGGAAIRALLVTAADRTTLDTFGDGRTLGAAVAIAIVAGLLASLVPALVAGRGDLASMLKAGPREGTYQRSGVRATLLIAQAALSVVLLIGAMLFVESLRHVRDLRLGYDAESVVIVSSNIREAPLDSVRRVTLEHELLAAAQSIPGVAGAAWASGVPIWSSSSMGLFVSGIDSVRRLGRFTFQAVTPDYFRTVGTRVVRGRGFSAADAAGAPRVTVVSGSMARALWPGRDPLGQCMHLRQATASCTTVVGVAEDIVQQQEQLTDGARYQYYLPVAQFHSLASSYVLVRVNGAVAPQVERIRKTLQAVMPGRLYVRARPMQDIVDGTRRSWRLGASLFVAFGALALVVAAVGLYGVMAYNVTQRMHELGVRVALGARQADILRLVVGQGVRFGVLGALAGSLLAVAAARWVEPLLFRQSATDPAIYAGVALLVVAVALLASAVPARRAAAADPNAALRSE